MEARSTSPLRLARLVGNVASANRYERSLSPPRCATAPPRPHDPFALHQLRFAICSYGSGATDLRWSRRYRFSPKATMHYVAPRGDIAPEAQNGGGPPTEATKKPQQGVGVFGLGLSIFGTVTTRHLDCDVLELRVRPRRADAGRADYAALFHHCRLHFTGAVPGASLYYRRLRPGPRQVKQTLPLVVGFGGRGR